MLPNVKVILLTHPSAWTMFQGTVKTRYIELFYQMIHHNIFSFTETSLASLVKLIVERKKKNCFTPEVELSYADES